MFRIGTLVIFLITNSVFIQTSADQHLLSFKLECPNGTLNLA